VRSRPIGEGEGSDADHALDLERLQVLVAEQAEAARRLGEELARTRARLQHEEELRQRLEETRAWRALDAYWRVGRRVRGMVTTAQAAVYGRLAAAPRPQEVVVGCVAENNARYLGEALQLLRSIRLLGGGLAAARRLVCVVDEVDAGPRAMLEAEGAIVRVVRRFDPRNTSANRFQFFDQALALGAEFLLSLDCDTLVVRDPLPSLRRGVFQARIEPVASVEMAHFARLFPRHGLRLPRPRYRHLFDAVPTIRYCNAGVIALPAAMARRFVPVWRELNARALDQLELLEGAAHHVHQASLTLAFALCPVPFRELPVALNYQLNMTHRPAPAEFLACDPAILHYHHQVDADGRLHTVPYPLAQRRIEEFERLSGGRLSAGPQSR